MKVLNICVNGIYTDGFSYHENLLPKYHKKNGHEVHIMTSDFAFDQNGQTVKDDRTEYVDENGVHIYRLKIKGNKDISYHFKRFVGFREVLNKIQPDVIFCHLFQFLDVDTVIEYKKKNPSVKLYFDSHSDYSNSAKNWLSKNIQHKMIWRYFAKKALPYAEKFYGVLPARVEFIKELYKVPDEKVELLVMGADDELADKAATSSSIEATRLQYGIAPNDILIVNGGKLDSAKKQTLALMDAVNKCEDPRVKLIIFGSVDSSLKDEFEKRLSERVIYIGWLESKDSYPLFACGDIAVFPGRHSVFWEQVAGQGIPMVVKYWKGTDDVDGNGNCVFLQNDTEKEIEAVISDVICSDERLSTMKERAAAFKKEFSYSYLAEKSIS